MNVTCPAVVSSSPRNSAARQPSSANVGLLYSPFHGSQPTAPGGSAPARSLNSSFVQLSHRHRRHISSKKVLVVRARSSDGDRGFVQKRFARERDDPASKFGVSWLSDGRVSRAPQKQQDKASWAESSDFWSSANHHASSGSSSGNSSSPNNQQRSFSPSQALPTNSNLTRKQQTRVINPLAATRLQNRLPAFKQAAEPDAFGASFSRVHGADAFSSFNGQSPSSSGALTQKPSSLEEGNSRNESVFTSKLEEILNKFRTRDKRSTSRDDPYEEGRRNGAAPSALQSDEIHNEEFQATSRKVNRLQVGGDWRTSRKEAQNPRSIGSVYETSVKDDDFNEEENVFSMASAERRQRGSRKEKRLGMGKGNVGGFYKTEGAPTNLFGTSTPLPWEEQGVRSSVKDDDFNEEENVFSTASADRHQRGSLKEKRFGMGKGNAGGLYKSEGAPTNLFGSSTPLPWEEQGVRSSVKDDDVNEEENVFSTASAERHQRGSHKEKRLGMRKGNAGGLYKSEGAPTNLFGSSTPLPWEEKGVRSPASKIQSPIRKGSSNFAGTPVTKSSHSSVSGNNWRSPNSESHDGHWSTGVEKPGERGKHSKPFSMSQKDHNSDAIKPIVSEFDWTDSDEEDNVDIVSSITADDGAGSSHSKKADQPSSGSSMGAKNGSPESTTNGKIATWHSHSNPSLPFEFQYSYSETPKARIIRYREAPYSPFGPDTMGRPWTGRPPLKKSTKKLPEFDSFKPPPEGKKGIKFVQSPGPFPEGQGPTPARSREEILGEPLSGKEIVELVDKCRSERRQLNLGRDGLTHNMLDLIHCHWKRRRVVKVKSMGVPTVDIDNVCFHLEDKTGGKIIYRTGGVVYLFRGRNYNYKDRPEIPLMLWKPISPVYPRLIKRAVEGLTIEEADKLRMLGQKVEPLCTLAKNGVYLTLVKDVRAAFRIDELVRIDCRGLNPSDYKKIGAKLRDLVPCVLLSFDDEQILIWKGKTMVSADVDADASNRMEATNGSEVEAAKSSASCGVGPADLSTVDTAIKVLADDADDESRSAIEKIKQQALVVDNTGVSTERSECSISAGAEGWSDLSTATGSTNQIRIPQKFKNDTCLEDFRRRGFVAGSEVNSSFQTVLAVEDDIKSDKADLIPEHTKPDDRTFDIMPGHEKERNAASDSQFSESRRFMESNSMREDQEDERMVPKTALKLGEYSTKLESSRDIGAGKEVINDPRVVRVDALWDQAIASGIAIQLDEIDTDSDVVVKKATELNKAVPAVGEYTRKLQSKLRVRKETTPRPDDDLRIHFANLEKAKIQKKAAKRRFRLPAVDVPDSGGLPVDELARLLSIK